MSSLHDVAAPRRPSIAIRAVMVLALLCALPASLVAQARITGRVVSAEDGSPIALAVVAVPGAGRTVFTAPDGSFVLDSVPPGRHAVHAEQIGRISADSTVEAPLAGLTLRMARRTIALQAVAVSATPGECVRGGFTEPSTAQQMAAIMEELRKNVDRQHLLTARFPFSSRFARTQQTLGPGGEVIQSKTDTMTVSTPAAPAVYAPGAVLANQGGGHYALKMPGVPSLTQGEFQRVHCFRYVGVRDMDGRRTYAIEFAPTSEVTSTDVEGTLFVDAADFLLRRAEFHIVSLPQDISYRALDVVTTYREVRPSMALLATLEFTQQLRNRRVQVEKRSLLGVDFAGADPGTR